MVCLHTLFLFHSKNVYSLPSHFILPLLPKLTACTYRKVKFSTARRKPGLSSYIRITFPILSLFTRSFENIVFVAIALLLFYDYLSFLLISAQLQENLNRSTEMSSGTSGYPRAHGMRTEQCYQSCCMCWQFGKNNFQCVHAEKQNMYILSHTVVYINYTHFCGL